ncbi:MAG: BtpA/SgcQ family protein [Clostridia bacterium]|nr:BtpA/SgcQ family protein [Clostridia bacterium]
MSFRLKDIFNVEKPVIAMAHFPPMPGSPLYDASVGVAGILKWVKADVAALEKGGADAIMFCNEGDRPYYVGTRPESLAVMASVVSRATEHLSIPFGVDILWDPIGAIALAKATEARFVREVFTGAYASDMGLWNTACADAVRYRKHVGADDVKLFFVINAEFAAPIGERSIGPLAKSVVFSSLADAVCVSGPMTGVSVDEENLELAKRAVPDTPVIANTGVRQENVQRILSIADGAIVGTALKKDGCTWNSVDVERVIAFMKAARE